MTAEILDFLERFQTLIVGVLGFAGIAWTLRANARHSQREHDRRIETERASLRRLFAAEFRSFSEALRKNIKNAPKTNEPLSVGRPHRSISRDISTELGSLEPGEVDVVANALISLDGMDRFLEFISPRVTESSALIPAEKWDEYLYVADTTAKALEIAIEVLEVLSPELRIATE